MASARTAPSVANARSQTAATWSGASTRLPLKPRQLSVSRVEEVRDPLERVELGVARADALLPCDLVEVAVVLHENDEARIGPPVAVLSDVDQGVDAIHLHRAVAVDRDDRAGQDVRAWP